MSKVTYDTYPRYVDIDRDGINQKVFTNSNGNDEWCLPTGRQLQKGPHPMDHSIRTDAMAIKKFCKYRLGLIYNEINIVRERKGLPPVKYMAGREECLSGL